MSSSHVCAPKASIRESINICRDDGGFSTVVRCVKHSVVFARFYRAGLPDEEEFQFDLYPVKISGDTLTFALPVEFWSYPVGYYNADIYHGDQFVRTIRVSLYNTPYSGRTKTLDSIGVCDDKSLPNMEEVVTCEDEDCPDIEPCEPTVTRIGDCCT